jgi:hypothetical protein
MKINIEAPNNIPYDESSTYWQLFFSEGNDIYHKTDDYDCTLNWCIAECEGSIKDSIKYDHGFKLKNIEQVRQEALLKGEVQGSTWLITHPEPKEIYLNRIEDFLTDTFGYDCDDVEVNFDPFVSHWSITVGTKKYSNNTLEDTLSVLDASRFNHKQVKDTKAWKPYRFDDVVKYAVGKVVLMTEDEEHTEAVRVNTGFVAINFIGIHWLNWSVDDVIEKCTMLKNTGLALLVYWCNDDTLGIYKANQVSYGCASVGLPCIILNTRKFFPQLPEWQLDEDGELEGSGWGAFDYFKHNKVSSNEFITIIEEQITEAAKQPLEPVPYPGKLTKTRKSNKIVESEYYECCLDPKSIIRECLEKGTIVSDIKNEGYWKITYQACKDIDIRETVKIPLEKHQNGINTKLLKKVIKRSGQSRLYKQLTKREFKEVRDFPNFTEVCMSIATSFYCMTKMMEEPKHEYLLRSFIWNHIFRNLCKDTNHFPVYACSPNLVELLQNTDPLEEYTTLKNVFTNCLILLPNSHNIFSDGKTNAKVTHILLSFYPHGYDNNLNQVPDYIMEYKDTDVDINRDGYNGIATLEGKCVSCNYPSLYYSFFDLDWIVGNDPNRESVAEGIIQFEGNNGNILRFGHEMKEDGYTVLSQIDSFVTNLFLFFQTQQNKEVTYVESRGFGQSKIKKKQATKFAFVH